MTEVKVSLNSIDKVKSFVNDITKFDYDFDLVSGRYVIDAKSQSWEYSVLIYQILFSLIYMQIMMKIKSWRQ